MRVGGAGAAAPAGLWSGCPLPTPSQFLFSYKETVLGGEITPTSLIPHFKDY